MAGTQQLNATQYTAEWQQSGRLLLLHSASQPSTPTTLASRCPHLHDVHAIHVHAGHAKGGALLVDPRLVVGDGGGRCRGRK